ncbi:MAG: hypothetical protein HYY23_04075 [Verrucomicrobia bacterium]|nr:hypothetical protein [Verrucomicrobiota bacterium]
MTTKQDFKDLCISILGDLLASLGYSFHAVDARPRGVMVDFRKGDDLLFVGCEENAIHADVILRSPQYGRCRVSLNQLLWYKGIKSVVNSSGCAAQLKALVKELEGACGGFLRGDLSEFDSRFCYPMNDSEYRVYLRAHLGE